MNQSDPVNEQNNRKMNALHFKWLLQMAWRDSRRSRSRLFLFISSVILGIAALVAIYSLGNNLSDEVNNQAASLLGADLGDFRATNLLRNQFKIFWILSVANNHSKEILLPWFCFSKMGEQG